MEEAKRVTVDRISERATITVHIIIVEQWTGLCNLFLMHLWSARRGPAVVNQAVGQHRDVDLLRIEACLFIKTCPLGVN